MTASILVLCTCPDKSVANALAKSLVQQRLAACVNILPEVTAIYRWQGHVQQENEYLLIIKSHASLYTELQNCLQNEHPYEVPEILQLPIEKGLPAYLDWITNSCEISK